jgi:hypothetical protein
MDVSVELTGLIKPDTPTPDVAPLFEYTDLRVDEDFMGQITGSVSLSLYDRALELIGEQRASVPFDYPDPYFCGLRVALDGQPVAWGLCTQPDMSSQQGRVVINMVDVPSVKMQAAFLRLGDEAIDPDSPYNGHVPPDFHGLRILRDAAELNAAQIAANWPTLSVMDGHAGTGRDQLADVAEEAARRSGVVYLYRHRQPHGGPGVAVHSRIRRAGLLREVGRYTTVSARILPRRSSSTTTSAAITLMTSTGPPAGRSSPTA